MSDLCGYCESAALQYETFFTCDGGCTHGGCPWRALESAEELVAELEDLTGKWTPTHKHKKGGLYRVIGRGLIEADLSPVVVYQDDHYRLWVRPRDEFHDGRFTALENADG